MIYLVRFLLGWRVCDGCGAQRPRCDFGIPGPHDTLWCCEDCSGDYLGGVFVEKE